MNSRTENTMHCIPTCCTNLPVASCEISKQKLSNGRRCLRVVQKTHDGRCQIPAWSSTTTTCINTCHACLENASQLSIMPSLHDRRPPQRQTLMMSCPTHGELMKTNSWKWWSQQNQHMPRRTWLLTDIQKKNHACYTDFYQTRCWWISRRWQNQHTRFLLQTLLLFKTNMLICGCSCNDEHTKAGSWTGKISLQHCRLHHFPSFNVRWEFCM